MKKTDSDEDLDSDEDSDSDEKIMKCQTCEEEFKLDFLSYGGCCIQCKKCICCDHVYRDAPFGNFYCSKKCMEDSRKIFSVNNCFGFILLVILSLIVVKIFV